VLGPLFIPPIQLVGGLVSLLFLAGFGWFFVKSRKGIAMRAVADNQQVPWPWASTSSGTSAWRGR
jgi:branched-chain amino acid transport system permease protein